MLLDIYQKLLQEELPSNYHPTSASQVIKDLIHLEHHIFDSYKSTPLFIDKHQAPKTHGIIHGSNFKSPNFLISPKKQYEISEFTKHIESFKQSNGIEVEYILEFGSGKSYLSRELLKNGYKIICVEINSQRVKTSKKLDLLHSSSFNETEKNILYLNNIQFQENLHKFHHFVNSTKRSNNNLRPTCLIIGLNSCGQVVPDLIMNTLNMQSSSIHDFLNVIGCCFTSCCFHKVDNLKFLGTFRNNMAISQDLRYLKKNDEIIENYLASKGLTKSDFSIESFQEWCFDRSKGIFSEFLILNDRVEYLKSCGYTNVKIETVFDFNLSSRNMVITCLKK